LRACGFYLEGPALGALSAWSRHHVSSRCRRYCLAAACTWTGSLYPLPDTFALSARPLHHGLTVPPPRTLSHCLLGLCTTGSLYPLPDTFALSARPLHHGLTVPFPRHSRILSRLTASKLDCRPTAGMGKTIQTIALLLLRQSDKPSLVVCPTVALYQWRAEIEARTTTGSFKVATYHGQSRSRDAKELLGADIILTTCAHSGHYHPRVRHSLSPRVPSSEHPFRLHII